MNLSIWTKRHFNENSNFEWPCPNCKSSSLQLVKDKFFHEETAESQSMRAEEDYWDTEWIRFVFSGLLTCKNCSEFITFTGKGFPEQGGYYDHEADDYFEFYTESFTPTYFQPALKIFDLPKNCPEQVQNEIIDSFKLFWSDLSACANKIRTSLEMLLDHEKVKKFENVKGKRKAISLHTRIVNYKNKELSELLLAIKWIGNTGSHIGKIETIDILEAYKLLEYSLKKLYNNEEAEIIKISKEINKRKGTRKRK